MSRLDWRSEADLTDSNSLRLPSRARVLASASGRDAVLEAFERAHALDLPVFVLGAGFNVVLPPRVEGVVLRLAPASAPEFDRAQLVVDGGCDWDALVRASVRAGYWGIENLAAIPGSVGAAPVQNIGAYGAEWADVCVAVEAFDRESGVCAWRDAASCAFGYRDSLFKRSPERWLITRVEIRLSLSGAPRLDYPTLAHASGSASGSASGPGFRTPLEVSERVAAVRSHRLPDPARKPNAGSFFKNPVLGTDAWWALRERAPECPGQRQRNGSIKVPAAWLIEAAGWRGRSEGAVGVSEQHALVLVHHGGGNGRDVLALASRVQEAVEARFGVVLEREPVALGWGDAPLM